MPNHVTTRCTVIGPEEDVKAFRARMFVSGEEDGKPYTSFDFNQIIPMPEILRTSKEGTLSDFGMKLIELRAKRDAPFDKNGIYDSHFSRYREELNMPLNPTYEVAAAYLKAHPEYEKAGLLRMKAIMETGFSSWYPWAIEKWGTKWGAYDLSIVSEGPLEFTFNTAWSFPKPVFEVLAKEYPTLSFKVASFDEGWNFACSGFFNPRAGEPPFSERAEATDELFEIVYGRKPEHDDDEESEAAADA